MNYSCTVWDPHEKGDTDKLEMVQRRGATYVKNRYHNRSSVSDLLTDLGWKSLQERRKEDRLTMFSKIVNNTVKIPMDGRLQPNLARSTPDESNSHIPYCMTLYRQQSFFSRTTRDWNSLPADIWSARSVETFRNRLTKHFI